MMRYWLAIVIVCAFFGHAYALSDKEKRLAEKLTNIYMSLTAEGKKEVADTMIQSMTALEEKERTRILTEKQNAAFDAAVKEIKKITKVIDERKAHRDSLIDQYNRLKVQAEDSHLHAACVIRTAFVMVPTLKDEILKHVDTLPEVSDETARARCPDRGETKKPDAVVKRTESEFRTLVKSIVAVIKSAQGTIDAGVALANSIKIASEKVEEEHSLLICMIGSMAFAENRLISRLDAAGLTFDLSTFDMNVCNNAIIPKNARQDARRDDRPGDHTLPRNAQ